MSQKRLAQGFIQVYTGDGREKTTCALGLALRAVGHGLKVYLVQFRQDRLSGGVQAASQRLAPEMTLRPFGRPGPANWRAPAPEDLALIRQAWGEARRVLQAGDHDLVILDAINLPLAFNLLPQEEVLAALRQRPAWVEVVLTGPQAPPELMAMADLVTEMRPLKDRQETGAPARRGIEGKIR
jgi:cob(I)alamin adenosyltransferase